MIAIVNINSEKFTFNGIPYYKNFMGIVAGDYIHIVNVYDSKIALTKDGPVKYDKFTVNGISYASAALLQSALLPALYTRNTLGGGGGGSVGTIDQVLLNGNEVSSDTPMIYPDNGIFRTVYGNGEASYEDTINGTVTGFTSFINHAVSAFFNTKRTRVLFRTPTQVNDIYFPNESGELATKEWTNLQGFEKTANKGIANGYAPLGSDSKLPATNSRPSNVTYNSANGVLTYTWADGSVQTIDLPIENLFQNASYNSTTKTLTLTTNGGGTIDVPLTDLVDLPEIEVSANTNPSTTPSTGKRLYLRADNGGFWIASVGAWVGPYYGVTSAEKTTWNGKQDALSETNFGAFSNSLTAKTTPVDTDTLNIVDSADSNKSKKVTLLNIWSNFIKNKVQTLVASATELGVAKLYTSLGSNTDGAITQKAVNDALDLKADKSKILINSSTITLTATTASQKLFDTLGDNGDGSFTLGVGRYEINMYVSFNNAGSTTLGFFTGLGDGTSAFSEVSIFVNAVKMALTATGGGILSRMTSFTSNPITTNSSANTSAFASLTGTFNVTTAGKFYPGISLTNAIAAQLVAGSYCIIKKV